MSGAMARRKGAQAERDVINWLQTVGFPHAERRGSGFEASDVIGIPGLTIEIKNQARLNLGDWVDQLTKEMAADGNTTGVVIHKRIGRVNPGDWYATMPASVIAALLVEAGYGTK